jgi:hypothetical protein
VVQQSKEDSKKAAMSWIGNCLQSIANSICLQISEWHWQNNDTMDGTTGYQLVVVGPRSKRIIKLFTNDELSRCLSDEELQLEIKERLTKLVTFIGESGSHNSHRHARKRR